MDNTSSSQAERKVKKSVLDQIESGEIRMTPRAYYTLKVVLLGILIFLLLITLSLSISYIIFAIQVSGRLILLGFGFRGIEAFLLLFPWTVFLIDLVLILLMEAALKRFRFGYRRSFSYLLSGIVGVSVIAGIVIWETPLHPAMLRQAESHQLPLGGPLYDHLRRPPHEQGIFEGVVTAVGKHDFLISDTDRDNDADSGIRHVIVPDNIDATDIVHVGDSVFVAGTVGTSSIQAYGIRKIETQQGGMK